MSFNNKYNRHIMFSGNTNGNVKGINNIDNPLITGYILCIDGLEYNLPNVSQLCTKYYWIVFDILCCLVIHIWIKKYSLEKDLETLIWLILVNFLEKKSFFGALLESFCIGIEARSC
jgi:hypothetical protein